mmetsp:Transcript_34355/g.61312  ORF Transcript_34355/g.61312 Transcript_34355/m.61312 type:complete len:223 (-) Transcript_34355:78-746(-)
MIMPTHATWERAGIGSPRRSQNMTTPRNPSAAPAGRSRWRWGRSAMGSASARYVVRMASSDSTVAAMRSGRTGATVPSMDDRLADTADRARSASVPSTTSSTPSSGVARHPVGMCANNASDSTGTSRALPCRYEPRSAQIPAGGSPHSGIRCIPCSTSRPVAPTKRMSRSLPRSAATPTTTAPTATTARRGHRVATLPPADTVANETRIANATTEPQIMTRS